VNGQCSAGGFAQNGQCYAPYTPGFVPQAATCYRGYNQMGQCYDTIGSDPSTVLCINGYIYGNYELGMCR
jgi:hypothetical protein